MGKELGVCFTIKTPWYHTQKKRYVKVTVTVEVLGVSVIIGDSYPYDLICDLNKKNPLH